MALGSETTRPVGSGSRRIGRSFTGALTALALVAAILASAAALPAADAADTVIPVTTTPLGFELTGSHGYAIQVYGRAARAGELAEVIIRAATRHGAVTYHFPASVEEGSIQADLGAYGEISVVFHPQPGGSGVAELGCEHGLSSAAGYYEGTITFHAKGLTAVAASRAKGDDGLAVSILCAAEVESQGPLSGGTYLEVTGGPRAASMTALLAHGGVAAQIEAGVSEEVGGVAIERSVAVVAPSGAFLHDGLRTATISPPAPFTGSATFRRDGAATSWRGDLRVDFPGRPDVALTGKGATARLVRAHAR